MAKRDINKMPDELLTPELLHKILRYEPESGKLYWRKRPVEMFEGGLYSPERRCYVFNKRYEGREAFTTVCGGGYKQGGIFGKYYGAHRIIWVLHYNEWPEDQIDHINGVRDDNRIVNLRSVSNAENSKNQKLRSTNKSGHTGVTFHKGTKRWQSFISVNGKANYLGLFDNFEDAVKVRKEAEEKYEYHKNHGRT